MRSGEKGYPGMMDRVLENDIERTNFINKRVRDINPGWVNYRKTGTVLHFDIVNNIVHWKIDGINAIIEDKLEDMEII